MTTFGGEGSCYRKKTATARLRPGQAIAGSAPRTSFASSIFDAHIGLDNRPGVSDGFKVEKHTAQRHQHPGGRALELGRGPRLFPDVKPRSGTHCCARHSTRLTRAFANRRCTMSEVSLPHCVQCRQPGYACIVRGRTVC